MVPLYKPYIPELQLLDEIIHSGQIASGKWTSKFENELKKYFGTDKLIVTSSFNTAISVAITTLGLKYGDEVIASPMACLASTQPYLCEGLKIKWADIDPDTGTLDPNDVKCKISSKTKLIIHNHFCGYVGYIDEINKLAKENNIFVIDDGIECFHYGFCVCLSCDSFKSQWTDTKVTQILKQPFPHNPNNWRIVQISPRGAIMNGSSFNREYPLQGLQRFCPTVEKSCLKAWRQLQREGAPEIPKRLLYLSSHIYSYSTVITVLR